MLRNAAALDGRAIVALYGRPGPVDHFLFDDVRRSRPWLIGMGHLGGATPANASSESPWHPESEIHCRDVGDPHLRCIAALTGYHLNATDDEIGHVTDFFVEGAAWSIHYAPVDTINWWPGRKVLISPHSIGGIDWTNRLVDFNVNRQAVAESPPYNATVTLDRFYARHYHSDYGAARPSHLH